MRVWPGLDGETRAVSGERGREPGWDGQRAQPAGCALSCPARARTWTLLIQSQTCCQLHHGATIRYCPVELRGVEPLTSWVRSRRSPN